EGLYRIGIVANAGGPVAAERRRDDADMDVFDRVELGLAAGARTVRSSNADWLPCRRVHADRIDEASDQVWYRLRQDELFVGHRRRVVDHEEEVDLRDFALFRGHDDA